MKWARQKEERRKGTGGAKAWLTGFPGPTGARAERGFSSSLLSEPVLILPYKNVHYQHNAATRTLSFAKQAQYF